MADSILAARVTVQIDDYNHDSRQLRFLTTQVQPTVHWAYEYAKAAFCEMDDTVRHIGNQYPYTESKQ